jgi:F-type H+-transporting ATPase subunit gamma
VAARPYAEKMHQAMRSLSAATQEMEHPLLEVRPEQNIGVVIIGADRGLAGAYNTNIMRKAMQLLQGRDPSTVKLLLAGKKSAQFFRRKPYEVVATLEVSTSNVSFADTRDITSRLRTLFEKKEVDAIYLVYAQFVNAMLQKPVILKLLPFQQEGDHEHQTLPVDYIFEPEPAELFAHLLPRYVDTQVYQALVEAAASEFGARMTAMTAASKNASDMIGSLTLSYNKARQAAITTELTEIVGGAEALG